VAFERDDEGVLLVSPTHINGGSRSLVAGLQLLAWAKRGAGGKVFDSSTVSECRAVPCARRTRRGSAPRESPRSRTTSVAGSGGSAPTWSSRSLLRATPGATSLQKIEMYARNGARYALGIDPQRRTTFAVGEAPAGLAFDIAAIVEA